MSLNDAAGTLLALVLLALAQQGHAQPTKTIEGLRTPGTISVHGSATTSVKPDLVEVVAGVVTQAAKAADAIAANTAQMADVHRLLKSLAIAEGDVRTRTVSVQPQYDHRPRAPGQPIIGYQATNELIIKIRDINILGTVLDKLVESGTNRITGIRFGLRDADQARNDVRRLAARNAREHAALYAEGVGVKLGRMVSLTEAGGGGRAPQPFEGAMLRAEATQAGPVPIAPGEIDIRAEVAVVFEIVDEQLPPLARGVPSRR